MLGLTRIFSKKPGLPPGSLVHVGEKKVERQDYESSTTMKKTLKSGS
jgi:hypothetical protein